MAILHILRHAKSSWDQPVGDHDRPLDERGERAASLMGAFIEQAGIAPDLVLCSSARRTRETLERIEPFLPPDTTIEIDERVYLASASGLLELVQEVGGDAEELLLIGHNPGSQYLASHLASGGDREGLAALRAKFPTAGFASIAVDGPLSEIDAGDGELVRFVTPKSLV